MLCQKVHTWQVSGSIKKWYESYKDTLEHTDSNTEDNAEFFLYRCHLHTKKW